MTLLVTPPNDTDGNGYPDQIAIVAALFAYPEHPTAMTANGAFVFSLYERGESQSGGEPIREWRYEGEDVRAAKGAAMYGACYRFNLSLFDGTAGDQMQKKLGDLRGRFEPADGGAPVYTSDEVRLVPLGG